MSVDGWSYEDREIDEAGCGSFGDGARILERQKLLQTSQVLFRHLCVSYVALLPFKDSQGETWPLDLSDLEGVPLGCTCQ